MFIQWLTRYFDEVPAEGGGDAGGSGEAAAEGSTVLTGAKPAVEENSEGDAGKKVEPAAAKSDDEGGAKPKDDKGTDDKAGEEGSQKAPDTYSDFTLPEDTQVDAAALETATPLFKELGLNQEQAQKVVDTYAKLVQESSQKQIDEFNQLKTDWVTSAKKDEEIGGDKFDENVSVALRAIDAYGTPELKQLLEDYGLGNHPEVIRFMVRAGKNLGEDNPGNGGNNSYDETDRVTLMYGK